MTSPLRLVDKLPPIHGASPRETRKRVGGGGGVLSMESNFVNDAVRTWYNTRARRLPIIPQYDALADQSAKAYFLAPSVQDVIRVTASMEVVNRFHDQLKFQLSFFQNKCRKISLNRILSALLRF